MALVPSLALDTSLTTHNQITVQEDTGVYNASTNTGGYGSPNVEATDMAQFLFAFKRNYSTDDTNLTDEIDNSLADNDSINKTWTLNVSSSGSNTDDGWYSFYLLVVNRYDAGTSYDTNHIVYSGTSLYKSLQDANVGNSPASSPLYWSLIDEDGSVATLDAILEAPNTYYSYSIELNDVLLENTEVFYANRVAEYSTEADGYADITEEMKELRYLEFFMRAAYANEAKENYVYAEKNIEILKDIRNGKVKTIL